MQTSISSSSPRILFVIQIIWLSFLAFLLISILKFSNYAVFSLSLLNYFCLPCFINLTNYADC